MIFNELQSIRLKVKIFEVQLYIISSAGIIQTNKVQISKEIALFQVGAGSKIGGNKMNEKKGKREKNNMELLKSNYFQETRRFSFPIKSKNCRMNKLLFSSQHKKKSFVVLRCYMV